MPRIWRTPSNIYPALSYEDAPAAIDWLCRAFGFEKRFVAEGADGTVMHSELSLGPGVIMVSSAKPDQNRVSPRVQEVANQTLCVRIEDIDGHYARAKAAGAAITRELRDEEYGSRGYMAADPEGHVWYFGTYDPGEYWES